MKQKQRQKIAYLGLFTAVAIIFGYVESLIPVFAGIPGIKLGLANVVTLILLVCFNERDAFLVLFVRILLGSICAGQMMSFMYSLCGGLLCFVTMALINRLLHRQFIFITSVFGAIAHNIGQLLVAIFLVRQPGILVYLPLMMISAVLTGLFTGFCAWFTTPRLEKQLNRYHVQR